MATSDNDPAIRRRRGGIHEIGRAFEGADLVTALIDGSNLVVAGGDQDLVRDADETDGGYFLAEPFNGFLPFPGHKVPQLDHVISASTRQGPFVSFPTDAEHMMRVSFERFHDLGG